MRLRHGCTTGRRRRGSFRTLTTRSLHARCLRWLGRPRQAWIAAGQAGRVPLIRDDEHSQKRADVDASARSSQPRWVSPAVRPLWGCQGGRSHPAWRQLPTEPRRNKAPQTKKLDEGNAQMADTLNADDLRFPALCCGLRAAATWLPGCSESCWSRVGILPIVSVPRVAWSEMLTARTRRRSSVCKWRRRQAYSAHFSADERVSAGAIGPAEPADRLLDRPRGGVLCVALESKP